MASISGVKRRPAANVYVAPNEFRYTLEHIEQIRYRPHIIGEIAGLDRLTDLHSRWIRYIWETSESRSLRAHRGSYKTSAIVCVGAVWWLLFNPNARIGLYRKTFTDASKELRVIRKIMETKAIQDLFEYVQGNRPVYRVKQDGALEWTFKRHASQEPSIEANGWDYNQTGKHYTKIINDDFITLRDRISRAERERTENILQEQINIVDPGCPISYIGTPWHRHDGWTYCPTPLDFSWRDTGIMSEEEIEQRKKRLSPALFSINYELKLVTDEGVLFPNAVFEPWIPHHHGKVFAHLDSAYDGDNFCALTILSKRNDGKIQGIGKSFAGNVKQWMPVVEAVCSKYGVSEILNETNADKGFVSDILRKSTVLKTAKTGIIEYSEHMNKHVKISTYLFEFWNTIVWDESTDDEYLSQITDYREGEEPDDAPDSAASLLRERFHVSDASTEWGSGEGLFKL